MNSKELNILNTGLKCAPRKIMNKFDLYIDTHKFIRTLNLKKYFLSHPVESSMRSNVAPLYIDSGLKNRSLFNPQNSNNHYIEVFKQLVLKDIDELPQKKKVNPEFIKEGIKTLEKNKDIIIRPADKGGGVVVMDKEFYLNQLTTLLSDSITYKRLGADPTEEYKSQLDSLIYWGYRTNALNAKEKAYLAPSVCRTPVIYTLPKIHKHPTIPPARPIVNGIGSVTSRLGEYLDKFLQPSVRDTKAFLKDTADLLMSLEQVKINPDSSIFLVTADVASLYTIIQHEDAALALNWALSKRDDIPHIQKKFLGQALDFCMSHNYFWFNGFFFSQQVGVAMGAKFAPSLANLFMAEWEDRHIFHNQKQQLIFYRRFIDDIFLMWEGSEVDLRQFLTDLNANTNNIKLDYVISTSSVNFLDVRIEQQRGKLTTKVYFKTTDRNSYLSIRSGHHPAWIKNIPKGQFLRVRRNCTEYSDYVEQANTLKRRFVQKGYDESNLNDIIQEVAEVPREQCLKKREAAESNNQHQWGFLTGFHAQYKEIETIFRKHWYILSKDIHLGGTIPEQPRFIYRKAPSFGDRVVRKILDPPNPYIKIDLRGFFPCRKCICCRTVQVHNRGKCEVIGTDGSVFEIKEFSTCNSSYIVYLLWCPCGLLYVGRTKRLLRVRIAEHLANIKKGFEHHSVSMHFKKKHRQDPSLAQFCGIDSVYSAWRGSNRVRDLSQRETQWIYLLKCLHPRGLNIEVDLNCFINNS